MSERNGIIVSVIMPAYNEEKLLEACFDRVVEALKEYGQPFEVILEEDGSSDGTPEIMDKLADSYPFVKALHSSRRMGKGWGIRRCFEVARGAYIVLIDSDLEYPPEKIPELLNKINGHDIVVGSRSMWINRKNGNVKAYRALLSRLYCVIIKALFRIDIGNMQDLQSGFKAFRAKVIDGIQPLKSNGFEIDSEILIRAQRKGFRIGFVPVTYAYKGNSKVNVLLEPVKMLISVLNWKVNGKSIAQRERTQHRKEYSLALGSLKTACSSDRSV